MPRVAAVEAASLVGQRFGSLVVVAGDTRPWGQYGRRLQVVVARCDCGGTVIAAVGRFVRSGIRQCRTCGARAAAASRTFRCGGLTTRELALKAGLSVDAIRWRIHHLGSDASVEQLVARSSGGRFQPRSGTPCPECSEMVGASSSAAVTTSAGRYHATCWRRMDLRSEGLEMAECLGVPMVPPIDPDLGAPAWRAAA